MNDSATETAQGSTLWLTFRMGTQIYAALLAEVNEVIRDSELTPVPGAAADMLGVRHLRGRIVPVMDGRRRLGLAELPAPDPVDVRVVMLAKGGEVVGLKVDAVGELIDSTGMEVAPPPSGRVGRADDPVSGVLGWRGGFVALLDVRKLCRLEASDADQA